MVTIRFHILIYYTDLNDEVSTIIKKTFGETTIFRVFLKLLVVPLYRKQPLNREATATL